MFAPRISLKNLAELCRRTGMSLQAGIDMRTLWTRETERPWGVSARACIGQISQAVQQGRSLSDGLAATGAFFPRLFLEMVAVGEETGHLPEMFRQLAEHYEMQIKLRRAFLASIAWPMTQLAMTIAIVGLLIWLMGLIGRMTGMTIDMLGFGLVGNRGLAIYAAFVLLVAAGVALAIQGIRRGMVWTRPIQRFVDRIPGLGTGLRSLALARLAWSLHLTMNSGMDVRKAVRISLQSTQNARFTDVLPVVDAELAAGNSIFVALSRSGILPNDFLDTLEVGEQSGKLVESMEHLSRQYQAQAQTALAALTAMAGFAIWALIAALITLLIFRLFSYYLGVLNNAAKM